MDPITPKSYFENRESWREWLLENHKRYSEFWVIYFKKHSGKPTVIYREALEEALCFGWIDGIVKSIDRESYMQRFSPRRKKSNWSETNKKLALKLLSEGRMHEAGLAFKAQWNASPETSASGKSEQSVPGSLEAAFRECPLAEANFQALPASCKNEYLRWILSGKRLETRQKRIAEAIALLEKGKRLGLK